jgi:putative addiction module component (TIGR02574 family)
MQDQIEQLAAQGIALQPEDRARLAEILLASLQEPALTEIAAAWDKEIVSRLAAYDRGERVAIDAEDVFAKARRIAQ